MAAANLEDKQQLVDEFFETVGDVMGAIQRNEDRLASHHALGAAANNRKHLDKIKVDNASTLIGLIHQLNSYPHYFPPSLYAAVMHLDTL